ncbi:aminotransferase class IV [Oscillatoria acuminata]|uniref:Branched-chain amino acid aminotransferase/4-amino-4-deoxychorismate lyase n=1 Tax=Oscillatoria acuminata PCC 6304 TaxID=56110 RepID=K9TDH5_9CYAN|nr:aminotransferase class IV [Oscillatoria acuminata]AFY80059.1 branched-chain amino acid aminotransferase/4-amino-4-deoxychorismate lyase [Oscillatoria acuminata PCC 6304]
MFFYNGTLHDSSTLDLSITDPALLYGATVFTTLRVYEQSLDSPLTAWQAHCARLKSSVEPFQWSEPDWQRVREGVELMMAWWPVLRIAIFPDGRELIIGRILPQELAIRQEVGVKAWVAADSLFIRSLPTHKTGNYLSSWLALQAAQREGCQEAILIDAQGNWLETSTGNLWGWREGRWWTPPIEVGILPGVMRSQLINCLTTHGHPATLEPWTADVVSGFEALAYSNSVVEVIPICEVFSENPTRVYPSSHNGFSQLRQLFLGQLPRKF